jgi:sugar lactone lactonase YvrE
MPDQPQLVLDAKAQLGEGPLWHAQSHRLYWVDIIPGEVHLYDPATGTDRVIQVGQQVGTVVPRASGGLMLALEHGLASLDLDTGEVAVLVDPERHLPNNRFNDGKCDPAGRFWAGTMGMGDPTPPGAGSLYCLDAQHNLTQRLSGVTCSNGLVWSLDQATFYYIDSGAQTVDAFDYDHVTGAIANRRAVITLPEDYGIPDGMTMDADGNLWVAGWGHHRLSQWNPANGEGLRVIELPVSQVTACAFGGPHLEDLYITSARTSLSPAALAEEPLAGGLFVVRPGVKGLPAHEFAG